MALGSCRSGAGANKRGCLAAARRLQTYIFTSALPYSPFPTDIPTGQGAGRSYDSRISKGDSRNCGRFCGIFAKIIGWIPDRSLLMWQNDLVLRRMWIRSLSHFLFLSCSVWSVLLDITFCRIQPYKKGTPKNSTGGNSMKFTINGFVSSQKPTQPASPSPETLPAASAPRKSVVQVRFPGWDKGLAYYNDQFDLKPGDRVYVDESWKGSWAS